jgi:hypothetical protein
MLVCILNYCWRSWIRIGASVLRIERCVVLCDGGCYNRNLLPKAVMLPDILFTSFFGPCKVGVQFTHLSSDVSTDRKVTNPVLIPDPRHQVSHSFSQNVRLLKSYMRFSIRPQLIRRSSMRQRASPYSDPIWFEKSLKVAMIHSHWPFVCFCISLAQRSRWGLGRLEVTTSHTVGYTTTQ